MCTYICKVHEIFYANFLQVKKNFPIVPTPCLVHVHFIHVKISAPLRGLSLKILPTHHQGATTHMYVYIHVTKLIENTVTYHDTKERNLLQQRVKGEHVHIYKTLRVSFNFKGSFVHDMEDLKITSHVSKAVQNGEAGHNIPFIESNGSLTRGMEREKTQKYLQKYTLLLFI